jgi:ribosomal protein L24
MATQTEAQKQQVRQLREERLKTQEELKNKRKSLGFEQFAESAPIEESTQTSEAATTVSTPTTTETTLSGETVNVGEGDQVVQRKGGIRELRKADGTVVQLQYATKDVEEATPSIIQTQEEIEKQEERLTTDISSVQRQITLQREQMELEAEKAKEVEEATTGALTASLAESRLGATTSAAGQAAEAGLTAIQRQSATFSNQLKQNSITLTQKERELERAIEDFDDEKQEALTEEIAAIQAENQEIQAQLEDTQSEQQNQLLSVIDSLGSSIGLLPPEQVGAQFESVGLPSSFGQAFALGQKQVLEAEEAVRKSDSAANQVKLQQAQADLIKTQQEIQSFGQQKATTQMQNFGYYQQLRQANPEVAEEFAKMTGITKESDVLGDQLKQAQINYQNARTEEQKIAAEKSLYELQELKGLETGGINIVNKIAQIPTDTKMTADQIYTTYSLPRLGSQDNKGQCGAFVNDVLNSTGKYGDTYQSKYRNVNNFNPLNPTAGSVFVANIGNQQQGHTGFVESVDYENQTATLVDMNRYGKEGFNRRTVSFNDLVEKEGIVGYENVATTQKNSNPKSGRFTEIVNSFVEEGLPEEDAHDLAIKQIAEEQKDMSEAESKSFTAYNTVVAENKIYSEILSTADPEAIADGINVLTRKLKDPESQISAEIVNRNISDPNTRRAILSELRWINSVLRKESGAAIAFTEYIDKGNGWFPRAGDDAKTLEDKAEARKREEQNLFNTMGAKGQKLVQDADTTQLRTITNNDEKIKIKNMINDYIQATDENGNYLYTLKDIEDTLLSQGINPKQFINSER